MSEEGAKFPYCKINKIGGRNLFYPVKLIFPIRVLTVVFFFLFTFSLIPLKSNAQIEVQYCIPPDSLVITQTLRVPINTDLNPLLKHQSTPEQFPAIRRVHHNKNINFLICLGLLFLLGIIMRAFPFYFHNTLKAFGNGTLSGRQLKAQLPLNSIPGLLLDILFYLSVALFIYQASSRLGLMGKFPHLPGIVVLLGIALVVALYFVIKFLFLKSAGWIFEIQEMMSTYLFNIFLFNRVLGIFLLPFTILFTFGSGLFSQLALVGALVFMLIVVILRYIRSNRVFLYFLGFSKFHFILYLCASEILPIAVVIKFISMR